MVACCGGQAISIERWRFWVVRLLRPRALRPVAGIVDHAQYHDFLHSVGFDLNDVRDGIGEIANGLLVCSGNPTHSASRERSKKVAGLFDTCRNGVSAVGTTFTSDVCKNGVVVV